MVGRLRERKYELGRPIGDRILYILPELLAAKKFRDVAPDRVALVCQLQGQPSGELVFFRIRMAYENGSC